MAEELIQSGRTFTITNAKAGSAIDLSAADNRSIIGFPLHGGTNQQWTTEWTSIGWTFRSRASGLYIGLNGSPSDGSRLVAVTAPVGWHIWHDQVNPSAYRIYAPLTTFNFDLYGHGDPAPGTPIITWSAWSGTHQTWNFTLV